jgi:hypothetical protein
MRNRIFHIGLTVAALGAGLALASPAGAAGRYTDATGDGKGAPDVSSVSVASDATGQIVFTINVDNLPSNADVRTMVLLNTDVDTGTGAPDSLGADYMFVDDASDHTYGFAHWTGSEWDWDTPYSTVTVTAGQHAVMFSVNRSEIGNTGGFNFWVRTRAGDVTADQFDDAPNDGSWNYTLAAGGPQILGLLVEPKPMLPRAGKLFTLTAIGLKLPPDGSAVTIAPQPESYSCTATLGGKPLAGLGTNGCSWQLPKKKTRGKTLKVVVTASYQGATISVPYTFVVS